MPFSRDNFKKLICVLHQTTYNGECDECAFTRGVKDALKLKALERVALKAFKKFDEEARLDAERAEAERLENERLETEAAAKALIQLGREIEVEKRYPTIVSLLKTPSILNGRRH